MPPAARIGDLVKQDAPHCHGAHPPAGPIPHPTMPLLIVGPGAPTVLIGKKPAAVVGDQTAPCVLPGCVPGGPGVIAQGSAKVMITKKPAARVNDPTLHSSCVTPGASPAGKILSPGCATVIIGG